MLRLDKTHRNKKRDGESWQLLLRMGWRVRAGDSRGGQVSHSLGEGDTATRPPTAFCPAIIWQECLGRAGRDTCVACNLCGANIRMLVSSGIISGGNEILYKRGGARVSQIFLTDVLQHSNTL